MSRPELPPDKRKVKRSVTLPKDVVDAGDASGNLSEWLTEAGREKMAKININSLNKRSQHNHNDTDSL